MNADSGAVVLNGGQRLALKYFSVAITLFAAQVIFGLLAASQYLVPDLLYNLLDFNVNRMVHINALVVWMLYGFIGSAYWLLEDESGHEIVGLPLANFVFWLLTAAVGIVVVVYLLVQSGPGDDFTLWFINEGREYIEAPRWADIGITFCMLVFFYNVAATFMRGRWSGIGGVLVLDLVALAGLYLAGMFYTTNISMDQFWWWWVIHLWVEATWEVLVGCIMAWALMQVLGVRRRIVQTWLYIEVAMMFGSGILGLGHHYFWIGTPEYWFSIGGFFSALEPVPLVAMVVHSVYDAGAHKMRNANHPAMAWIIAHTFGNFFGAGVWGFMHTLPQINLYTHGTQWSASHGHFAFFGAYATIIIAMIYIALQRQRGNIWMGADMPDGGWKWKWALGLLNLGVVGMTIALMISGFEQAFIERAVEGSTWAGYFTAQNHPWFQQGMIWRFIFGVVTACGLTLLVWDLLTIGRRETRRALQPVAGVVVVLLLLLAAGSLPAYAGDTAAGRSKAEACAGCHGDDGISVSDPLVPVLAGQSADYLAVQLMAFRQGVRQNEVMNAMAEELSDSDIQDLAAFFAALPAGAEAASAPPPMVARGKAKYAACAGCHGLKAEGDGMRPRLAGQSAAYTLKQMRDYASGARRDPVMEGIAAAFHDDDFNHLAEYIASLTRQQ
ncbi:MAG: cbb3-type cytochrome c oxidase subunit I [Mariprofundaceae bacterium]|nr:cbb3-type cytochrome c oxidase subunit I [Mariprofundaceae bacterium]